MKKWKKINVEDGLMKDIQSIIGSNESKSGFATAAIEKEIKRIKRERYELDMEKIVNEFRNNSVPYSKKGINNVEDFVTKLMSNTKDIRKLEKEYNDLTKEVRWAFAQLKHGYATLGKADGGSVQLIMTKVKKAKKPKKKTKKQIRKSK